MLPRRAARCLTYIQSFIRLQSAGKCQSGASILFDLMVRGLGDAWIEDLLVSDEEDLELAGGR